MSKISDALKHAATAAVSLVAEVDEEPKPVKPPVSIPVAQSAFNSSSVSGYNSPFSVSSTNVLDEKVYKNVLSKTDFAATAVGKTVQKYYDALEGISDPQRMKVAISQAQKLDGITPDQVLQTFDQLQEALDKDSQGFAAAAAKVEQAEIISRQDKISAKQQQVSQLNAEIQQLQTELMNQQSLHSNATTQYGLAQQRRSQEITTQKSQFAALLQH